MPRNLLLRPVVACIFAVTSVFFPLGPVFAAGESVPAEELLFLELPGVITRMSEGKVPVSVTTITEEDIRVAPARRITDLLEIFVPNLLVMTHTEGDLPGIRGITSDRRYKFLLLVNGKVLNTKGHGGAISELDIFDLGDIQKIDIIRGPGSVTYGPGAIMGVVSITLKNAATAPGLRARAGYMSGVNSSSGDVSYGVTKENYNLYLFGALAGTKGLQDPKYWVTGAPTATGYAGPSYQPSAGSNKGIDYFRDPYGVAKVKLYADLNFRKAWRFWMRYTHDGSSANATNLVNLTNPVLSVTAYPDGGVYDISQERDIKQAVTALENEQVLSDRLSLKSSISLMSTSHSVYRRPAVNDRFSAANYGIIYAEDEMTVKSILKVDLGEKYNLATGLSAAYNHWGPAWGDSPENFRMGDNRNIVSDAGSNAFDATAASGNNVTNPIYVGSGWGTYTYSVLGELNMNLHKLAGVLVSGRADKNDHSKLLFSPRVALVSDWGGAGVTKLIVQESNRMSTAEQLLEDYRRGQESSPDKTQAVEIIYNPPATGSFQFNSSAYYNYLEVLSWDATNIRTTSTGKGSLCGIELEGKCDKETWMAALNHSIARLLDWKLEPGIRTSGISYMDYNNTSGGVTFRGTGNANINNWSEHITKMYGKVRLFDKKLTLFSAARVYWNFEGGKDQIEMVEKQNPAALAQQVVKILKDNHAYDTDLRMDVSASYDFTGSVSAMIFVRNLVSLNGSRIYYYDTGFNSQYPARVQWTEDPQVIGCSVSYKF